MSKLLQFDVRGEQIVDEVTEAIIRKGDPHRSLVRYPADGSYLFVSVRINMALLEAAAAFPVIRLKPQPRPDELMPRDGLLTPAGSVRNYQFLENLVETIEGARLPACYLAEQHGDGRRDFYFVTEDVAGLERLAQATARKFDLPLTTDHRDLREVAPTLLPREAIGDLGLDVPAEARMQPTRFEFWGAEPSLARLRAALEQRGYRFLSLETYLGELRMTKTVPIDHAFQDVLKEIVPLARSLGCSYRGTETVDGGDQFLLTRPLPERYTPAAKGMLSWLFGRRA